MSKKTPFYDLHIKRNAEMVERAGWLMPRSFGDAAAEHLACREYLTVCDLSDHYRIRVSGPYAKQTLNKILTCDVESLPIERQCVGLICNEDGNIIELLHVQHQEKDFLLIGHPHNYQRVLEILQEHSPRHGMKISDETDKTALVSLQGPTSLELLREKMPFDLGDMNANDVIIQSYFFMRFVISFQAGGPEPGVCLIIPAKAAGMAWEMLAKYGESYGAKIAGLEAQNSLRIEAGTPAIETEIHESVDPFSAGLGEFVCLEKEDFLGAEALRKLSTHPPKRKLVGIKLTEPLEGQPELANDGDIVGAITSSCYSPCLKQHIGLGYADAELAKAGRKLSIGGSGVECTVSDLPFVEGEQG